MTILETDRLTIRDNMPKDLEDYHKLFNDKASMKYLPGLYCSTKDESRKNLMDSIEDSRLNLRRKFYFAVTDKNDGTYFGQIGFTKLSESMGSLGYFLLPEFRKNGYATEAVRKIIEYAFRKEGLEVINCGCHIENRESEKLMIRLGMSKIFESDDRIEYEINRTLYQRRRKIPELW